MIAGFKTGCRRAQRAIERAAAEPRTEEKRAAAEPQPTEKGAAQPTEKATEKGAAQTEGRSLQVMAGPSQDTEPYHPLFAKGYNDLILRSYDELPTWQNYLKDNPRRLMMKRSNPDYLRPFFDLQKGTYTYNGIGNRQLLAAPRRRAVILSRHLTSNDIEREVRTHLEEARQGVVFISAAISPAEKKVMRAVFDAGFPTVVLMENGFTPITKPHGEQFYACARGTLLMLSPWEHHNEKKVITATQCRQLNMMALELCE